MAVVSEVAAFVGSRCPVAEARSSAAPVIPWLPGMARSAALAPPFANCRCAERICASVNCVACDRARPFWRIAASSSLVACRTAFRLATFCCTWPACCPA
jgi:hypothetical protein